MPIFLKIEKRLEAIQCEPTYYLRFDGHQVRLGHYYRHLFQAVDFVHRSSLIEGKPSYIKMLRAQLSTHEQILLLVNALTPLGWRWFEENLIQDYGLVKNIPAGMVERYCGISVRDLFKDGYWESERNFLPPAILDKVSRSAVK